MKSVLISIQPKWCELIANGKKTVEVRKTKPKLDTPFKVYIYCTKDKKFNFCTDDGEQYTHIGNGKVIGEFVCDEVYPIKVYSNCAIQNWMLYKLSRACLTLDEVAKYIGANKTGYGWHISDLVIYDKPKELSEFRSYNVRTYLENGYPMPTHEIKRPPQSWCYVEGGASDA